jgi:hypothetical protein
MLTDKEKIYDVEYRGEYLQYWLPKKQPGVDEQIARQQNKFITLSFDYTLVPLLLLPADFRSYLLIQNLSLANDLWIGFDTQPDPANSRGIRIAKELAFEPGRIPQNAIWVMGSPAVGKGTILYSID